MLFRGDHRSTYRVRVCSMMTIGLKAVLPKEFVVFMPSVNQSNAIGEIVLHPQKR